MRQANYTGELPAEVLDAVENQLGQTEDLRQLINLPAAANFLGYLIYDGEAEEFLYKAASELDLPTRRFSEFLMCENEFFRSDYEGDFLIPACR